MTMVHPTHDGTSDGSYELRCNLHAVWSAVAPGWDANADFVDEHAAPVNDAVIDSAQPQAGDLVLELACGPGGLGLALAPLVAPEGTVVMTDVAPEMVAIARDRAEQAGLTNVETREADIEAIDEPDAAYDVVVSREGLMFALEPARAFGEIRRVLRPGGRMAAAVWGPRPENPWLGAILDVVGEHLGREMPPPGIPGPFSLSDAANLEGLLRGAGFEDVAVREVPLTRRYASFEHWWEMTTSLAGPVAGLIKSLPDDGRAALRERAAELTRGYEMDGGLNFPAVALRTSGRVPASSTESEQS
jgi:SAM-dependent methyltransferase